MSASDELVRVPGQNRVEPLSQEQLLGLYRAMRTARTVNVIEAELASGGDAFFYLPTMGHEASAVWQLFLEPSDWVFGHYRNKALGLARGLEPKAFFDSILCNAENYSHGRQMCCFMASRALNMPSTVVPVGNNAIQSVGIAAQIADAPERPIVYCGMGDGTTQQGEVYEAIAEAVRRHLPVLFVIEDNGYAISTPTAGQTFFHGPRGPAEGFLGLALHRFDGRDVMDDIPAMEALADQVRAQRGPAIAVVRMDRLSSHTNADDERVYRPAQTIADLKKTADPLANLRRSLAAEGIAAQVLDAIDQQIERDCRLAAELSRRVGDPAPLFTAKAPLPEHLGEAAAESRGDDDPPPAGEGSSTDRLTMIEAMRAVLRHRLSSDARVYLHGQDIEDPKGDVFGVTRGLSSDFPGRVVNAALSESTIIGTSIGRAMAGGLPVGFIQFADFLPNGLSQILSEMGSIYWRSGGEFDCPLILMIVCGAYRPGLGPFHAQTFESLLAHTPGVDVMMPSTAADAAGMLNAAFESNRPTVFLYPKVCLNDRNHTTPADVNGQLIPVGRARCVSAGDDLTIVGWGSTMSICRDVAETITSQSELSVDLIDLRCIDPWDRAMISASAGRTGRLLVVHEDNLTAGFGAEILAAVAEDNRGQVDARRVTRADTYVPCNYTIQLEVLPSFRRTLSAACDLLELVVDFNDAGSFDATDDELATIEAQGSSPADQVVSVSAWKVAVGEAIKSGQVIADMEADKAVFEFSSPMDGTLAAILIEEGREVDIGTPMLKVKAAAKAASMDDPLAAPVVKRQTREDKGRPTLRKRASANRVAAVRVDGRKVRCYLTPVHIAEGADRLTNSDFERRFPGKSSQDIIRRTGIESRPYCAHNQSALSLAMDAASKALADEKLSIGDLTGIVCHTTTPPLNTPSMACMLLKELDPSGDAELMVYDVNAACSGWLYALDAAHNSIQHNPDASVLVVTTECLSRVVNPADFDTAILFGDAATATIMRGSVGDDNPPAGSMLLSQPVLSGKADLGPILTVGFEGRGHITMDGKRVFSEAVRAMTKMTRAAFERSGIGMDELDWLIPHQANARIFEAVRARLDIPNDKVINLIRHHGNTSSSSIPLSIGKSTHLLASGQTVGLCAFGGGFTFGAAILEIA